MRASYKNPSTLSLIKSISYYCLPVILLQWLGVLTSTLSTRFLAQYHGAALAASSLTYRVFLIILLCLNGMQFAQGVLIAKHKHCSELIVAMNYLILLIGLILGGLVLFTPHLLQWTHQSQN